MQASIGTSSAPLIYFEGGKGDAYVIRFNGACTVSLAYGATSAETQMKAGEVIVIDPKDSSFKNGMHYTLSAVAPVATTCSIDRGKYQIVPVATPIEYANPSQQGIFYHGSAIAPHAGTTRATYTCPTGRKAQVTSATAFVQINGAAAPAGERKTLVYLVPNGTGNYMYILRATVAADNNTVGNTKENVVGVSCMMSAGDALKIDTADSSTGGTVNYDGSTTITEFDA